MRYRDRDITRIAAAPFSARHWQALTRMLVVFEEPIAALCRYITNGGVYPWSTVLRTPIGPITVTLHNYHDLLTLNEIFCRGDYGDDAPAVVMDVGANRGLAALYFLTRRSDSRVHCFEPDPANIALLRQTLADYEGRYVLTEKAVTATPAESVRFVPAGRYGRLAAENEAAVELPALSLAAALRAVVEQERRVDLVKIDTEGTEPELVAALRQAPDLSSVRRVVYEDNAGTTRWVSL